VSQFINIAAQLNSGTHTWLVGLFDCLMYEIQPRPEIHHHLMDVQEEVMSWQSVAQRYFHVLVERVITEDMVC
jgi:hypothetical protein